MATAGEQVVRCEFADDPSWKSTDPRENQPAVLRVTLEGGNPGPPQRIWLPGRDGYQFPKPDEPLSPDAAKATGAMLWDRCVPPAVTAELSERLGAAEKAGTVVRLEFVLWSNVAQDMPWELLRDARGPLVLRPECRLVRAVPVAVVHPPLPVRLPLRVLVIATNPKDETVLDLDQELRVLVEALKPPQFEVTVCPEPTLEGVKAALARAPHVIHYVGHSGVQQGQGNVILHDPRGETVWLSPDGVAAMLPLTCRLICLSTCVSRKNYHIAGLLRMAQAPANVSLPTLVVNQYPVRPETAAQFWRAFYCQLVVSDGSVSQAVHAGRGEVHTKWNSYDWASFVTVVRDGSGRPFRFLGAVRTEPSPLESIEIPTSVAADIRAQFAVKVANDMAARVAVLGSAAPKELLEASQSEAVRAAEFIRKAAGANDAAGK
jgi:hypothetical protein